MLFWVFLLPLVCYIALLYVHVKGLQGAKVYAKWSNSHHKKHSTVI